MAESTGQPPDGDGAAQADPPLAVRINDLVMAYRDAERTLSNALGLHPTDTIALQFIQRRREVTPSQLAQHLAVTSAAVTFVIERLVTSGHVERVPNPADRRSVLIRQQPRSDATVREHLALVIGELGRYESAMSAAERAAVDGYLAVVLDVFQRTARGSRG